MGQIPCSPRSNTRPASTHTGLRASQELDSSYSINNAKCEVSALCKSGHILTAADRCVVDIVVDRGKIRAVCINAVYLNADAEEAIAATGKHVIAAGILPP